MSQPPSRAVQLPARRPVDASQLIKSNRTATAPEDPAPSPRTAPPSAPNDRPEPTNESARTAPPAAKAQVSVMIDPTVRDNARAALRLAAFYEDVETFAELVEGALKREVARLQDAYNDGEPIEPRDKPLKPGRRVQK